MPRWRPALAALIFLISLATVGVDLLAAPALQEDIYIITYPGSGSTISGVVEITGSANHPNFASYGVFYAPGATATENSQWVRITFEETPVTNGVLATWDTAAFGEDGQPAVPNGVYTLALARYRQGNSGPDVPLFFVDNITVNNEAATPPPTPTTETTPLPTAVGATPTPVPIEQPPTATPASSPTPGPGDELTAPPEEDGEGGGFTFDTDRLRGAFLDGARLTLLLFGLWGIYVIVKAVVRYLLRNRQFLHELPFELPFDLPFELPWRRNK